MSEEMKRFQEWAGLAEVLHKNGSENSFREREIWWYAAGENIGSEINGKSDRFSRPILIVRKYGNDGFFGIPLSSQAHDGIWYYNFIHKNRRQCALLSQSGSFSACRLYSRTGKISRQDFEQVCQKLSQLILKK